MRSGHYHEGNLGARAEDAWLDRTMNQQSLSQSREDGEEEKDLHNVKKAEKEPCRKVPERVCVLEDEEELGPGSSRCMWVCVLGQTVSPTKIGQSSEYLG